MFITCSRIIIMFLIEEILHFLGVINGKCSYPHMNNKIRMDLI